MRTSLQFTKIGIPLIVLSLLVAVAIILIIVLSKEVKEPTTKGKFISSRRRDLIWRALSRSIKLICALYLAKKVLFCQSLIMQLTRDKNSKEIRICSKGPKAAHENQRNFLSPRSPLHRLSFLRSRLWIFSWGGVRFQQTFRHVSPNLIRSLRLWSLLVLTNTFP